MIWVISGILIVSAAFFFVLALMDVQVARVPSADPDPQQSSPACL
jgi:hypothetical protein